MEHIAYIGLGSNIEPRTETLAEALRLLDGRAEISVRRTSRFVQTDPVGGPDDQPMYANAAAELATDLGPEALLSVLHEIEAQLGRDRSRERRWGARTCDLDLLLFDEMVIESEELTLPHPRMHERPFVLEPLAQIAGQVVHPVLGKNICELLAAVEG